MSEQFKDLLNKNYKWPCDYTFKFIVPQPLVKDFLKDMQIDNYEMNASSTGKYISITFLRHLTSADEVILVYEKASETKGIIAL